MFVTAQASSELGPDVGALQSGLEHRIPTRFAMRSIVCREKSSRGMI
jgi:hypothetical protein